MEHSKDYILLKHTLTYGQPFMKAKALERINGLADKLQITQAEAEELTALANSNGADILPDDAMGRLDAVETAVNDLTLLAADMMGGAL